MKLASVPIGRGQLSYWRRPAAGPTVLLLHGLVADHAGLLPMTEHWPDADVVAPDLPGHGRSTPLPRHTLPAFADAIEAFCDRLGLPEVHVVGHSLGATIALVLAARHPDRVRSAVLLSPVVAATGRGTWATHAYYRLGSMLPTRMARSWFLGPTVTRLSNHAMVRSTDPDVRRRIIAADLKTAAACHPRLVSEVYDSVCRAPFTSLIRRVTAPTLIVSAAHDRLVPYRAMEALRDTLPYGDLRLVPDGGHLWPVEDPAAAAALCRARFEGRPVRVAATAARAGDRDAHRRPVRHDLLGRRVLAEPSPG